MEIASQFVNSRLAYLIPVSQETTTSPDVGTEMVEVAHLLAIKGFVVPDTFQVPFRSKVENPFSAVATTVTLLAEVLLPLLAKITLPATDGFTQF
jgi:hypothetical protein